jgi:hypothetical protein
MNTFLLPELRCIIGQYAIRCEYCFDEFLNNGVCAKCIDTMTQTCITWQSINDYRNDNLCLYDHNDFKFKLHSNKLKDEQTPLFNFCLDTTFIVFEQIIDIYNPKRRWLLLSYCLDHQCTREIVAQNDLLAIVKYEKQWRPLTQEEAEFIFDGCYTDGSWSKWRRDEVAHKQFWKRYKNKKRYREGNK